jgi:DNA-binding beta-propeller fold protein YncE
VRLDENGSVVWALDGFNEPSGAAVTADGGVVVADASNRDVVWLDGGGGRLRSVGGFGRPYRVAAMADGVVVVADSGRGEILRLAAAAPQSEGGWGC